MSFNPSQEKYNQKELNKVSSNLEVSIPHRKSTTYELEEEIKAADVFQSLIGKVQHTAYVMENLRTLVCFNPSQEKYN